LLDLFCNFRGQRRRLWVIEHKAACAWSVAALALVYFFQECPERVRVISRVGHQSDRHHAGLQFLLAAVAKKGKVHAERDAQLGDFVLPYLRWRYTRRNSNGSLHEKLARQLYCPVSRCHVADFVGNHGSDFVVGGRDFE
jgi:hypothetical protein